MVQQTVPSLRFEPIPSIEGSGYRLYRHIRSGGTGTSSTTLSRTLEIMLVALSSRDLGPSMPPADLDVLTRLASAEDWEGTYQREQAEEELGPEDRDLRENLLWLKTQLPGYQAAIEGLTTRLQQTGDASWDDARIGEKIWNTFTGAVEKSDEIEARLRARIDEYKQAHTRSARVEQIYASLLEHYAGRGPQYEITCHSLAVVSADLESLRRPGARASQGGVDSLHKLVLLQQGLVNQLQKFTESTKVDVTDGKVLRELADAIATCALRRIIPIYPQLAREIVEDMQRELLARGVPGAQPTNPPELPLPLEGVTA